MVVGDFPLDGKVCLVTGGGSGINLAFVKLALQHNARVLIADLRLLPEAAALVAQNPGKLAFTTCDVASWPDLDALPAAAVTHLGSIPDIWIAGAGVFEPSWSSFLCDDEPQHYAQLQINAAHPIKLTRIALRACLGVDKPCVVLLVASMSGVVGQYGSPLYSASKHAVVGFTKSMAQADADERCKIVCLCPSLVATPLWTGVGGEEKARLFSLTDEMCITAEEAAEAMKELVEEGRYGGGSLLEVGKVRKGLLDSVDAARAEVEGMAEWRENNYRPVRNSYREERGVGL